MNLKPLLGFLSILGYLTGSAQAEKGDVLLGTQFSYYSSETNSNSDYSEYTFFPTVAIYFSPTFNMGLGVEFFGFNDQTEIETPNNGFEVVDTKLRLRTYNVLANAHSKLTERLYFNTAVSLGIGRGSVEYDNDFTTEVSTLGLALRPGLFFFTTKTLILTANIAELSVQTSEEEIDDANGFNFSQRSISEDRVQIGLGLEYIRFGVMFLID